MNNQNLEDLVVEIEKIQIVTPKFNLSNLTSDSGDHGENPSDGEHGTN
ncbi:MAG: hypothetical protein U0Y10_20905 [Spirosomataceae bacterium]